VCNCLIDEGRPLGTGWQEQVPLPCSAGENHQREKKKVKKKLPKPTAQRRSSILKLLLKFLPPRPPGGTS
jgi:hypothetical protein